MERNVSTNRSEAPAHRINISIIEDLGLGRLKLAADLP